MKTVSFFVLVLFVALLACGSAFSTPRYPDGCNIMPQKDNLGNAIVLCDNPNNLQVATKDQPQYNRKNEVEGCQYEVAENGKNKYYITNYKEGNANSVSTQCPGTDNTLGLDGRKRGSPAHSHPIKNMDGKRLSALWPSNADVLSALLKGENVVRINAQPQNPKARNAAILYDIYGRKCWLLGKDDKREKEIMLSNYYDGKTADGGICWQANKKDNGCYRVENLPDPLTYQGDKDAFYSRYGHNAFNPNDTEKLIAYAKKFKRKKESGGDGNTAQPVDLSQLNHDNLSGDWDCCRCENPDDRDFRCKKCGKIPKWLAPKPDEEFLQWLKK